MPVILTERVLNKELLTGKQRKFKERTLTYHKGFPGGSMVKSACQCRRHGSIAGSGRSPGEGDDTHSDILA